MGEPFLKFLSEDLKIPLSYLQRTDGNSNNTNNLEIQRISHCLLLQLQTPVVCLKNYDLDLSCRDWITLNPDVKVNIVVRIPGILVKIEVTDIN